MCNNKSKRPRRSYTSCSHQKRRTIVFFCAIPLGLLGPYDFRAQGAGFPFFWTLTLLPQLHNPPWTLFSAKGVSSFFSEGVCVVFILLQLRITLSFIFFIFQKPLYIILFV